MTRGLILPAALCLSAPPVFAQTPSPLQEWQYSGGIVLQSLFQPDIPKYQLVTGLATALMPVYDGSRAYRLESGPVVNFRYRDDFFVSTGEGIGYNLLHDDHFRFGVAMGYDLGRKEKADYDDLRGMGNVDPAPVAKVFGSWVLSKRFPLVMRADARQFIGGAEGVIGDVGAYLPMPGSSKNFVLFIGPSITFATHHYLQTLYGVTPEQSLASGHPQYDPHAGEAAVGVGLSASKFMGSHWLVNLDAALNQIRGSAASSPLVERRTQRVMTLSLDYRW
jgi:outer membrane scaffolding protein for murein synthesis (MipA/OmpV family)